MRAHRATWDRRALFPLARARPYFEPPCLICPLPVCYAVAPPSSVAPRTREPAKIRSVVRACRLPTVALSLAHFCARLLLRRCAPTCALYFSSCRAPAHILSRTASLHHKQQKRNCQRKEARRARAVRRSRAEDADQLVRLQYARPRKSSSHCSEGRGDI